MNCRHFDATLIDLARHAGVDAGDCREALSHVKSCANCANRVAIERALTVALEIAVREDVVLSAPVGVERALRAAFPAQQRSSLRSFFSRPLLAAAAVGAITAGIVMFALWPAARTIPVPRNRVQVPIEQPAGARLQPPQTRQTRLGPPQIIAPVFRRRPQSNQKTTVSRAVRRKPRTAVEQPEVLQVATDFLPMTNQSGAMAEDRAGLVRIRLPRTALRPFGLLMNEDRAAEQIDADVLLGEDGQARAVRFVQNISTQRKRGNNENRN